jgi:secreted trypsin-like serine protease
MMFGQWFRFHSSFCWGGVHQSTIVVGQQAQAGSSNPLVRSQTVEHQPLAHRLCGGCHMDRVYIKTIRAYISIKARLNMSIEIEWNGA